MSLYEGWFGLRPVVNAMGSVTSLGGSRMSAETVEDMRRASRHYVDLTALLRAAGDEVARLCRAPPGYTAHVVTGSAAALALAVAACITGGDPALVRRLPDTAGIRHTILLDAASDSRWNQSMLLTGARIEHLGAPTKPMTAAQLAARLGPAGGGAADLPVAVVVFAGGLEDGAGLAVPEVLRLAHRRGVPVIVDAAAQLPPRSNLWRWTAMGADLVVFSGGKEIAGPQTSGILLGRRALIEAARLNGAPNEVTVGRPMKCSKEDIVGLVSALRQFCAAADAADASNGEGMAKYDARLALIEAALQGGAPPRACRSRRVCPGPPDIQPNIIPRLFVDLHPGPGLDAHLRALHGSGKTAETPRSGGKASAAAAIYGHSLDHGNPLAIVPRDAATVLAERLAGGNPIVAVNTTATGIMVNPQTITLAEARLIGARVAHHLSALLAEGVIAPWPASKL